MKSKTLVASGVALLVSSVFLIPSAHADNTVCDGAIILIPDGSMVEGVTTASNQDRWFRSTVRTNRSYAIVAENLDFVDTFGVLSSLTPVAPDCLGANLSGVNNTQLVAPNSANITNLLGADRRAFISTADQDIFFRVNGAASSGHNFRIRIEETTLYNPAWSTFGTFETFYSCVNTTNVSTLDATLKLFDTTGAEVASFDFINVPAGGTVSRNTGSTSLNVTNNLNGSATLAHNGPPGAFICEAAIADFATAPRVIQPVKFEAARQQR